MGTVASAGLILLAAVLAAAEDTPLTESGARIYGHDALQRPAEPIRLAGGPHLFLDEFLIESADNLRRVVNSPTRDGAVPNPVITGKEDGCFQPYMTVLRDPQTGRFRLWFGHRTDDSQTGRSRLGYTESDDGIDWQRPVRVLEDPAPIQFGVSVVDWGPDCPEPARRYTYAWYMDGGLKLASSPDGLVWTPLSNEPVIKHNHDITGLWYDPLRRRYVAIVSGYRPGEAWSGDRRVTMHSHSADLRTWSSPRYVVTPNDAVEEGQTQFYAMDGYLARGELVIGMVKVLRDDLKADDPPDPADAYGVGYTSLAWTRDGDTWFRDTAHFFDPDPRKGAWDHAHAWIDEQVPVGDGIYLYYGGYARGHKVNRFEERQIGLVKMKRDRYVAREAGDAEAKLVTPPVILEGHALTLNADADEGTIEVQVLGEDGMPLDGYAFDDSSPVKQDALEAPVSWRKPLDALQGRPVRLEFRLRNARLFAFNTMP